MKWFLLILFFISCRVHKPLQVKVIYLTVIKIQGDWITWSDGDGFEVYMTGYNYKVGDRMPYLITK